MHGIGILRAGVQILQVRDYDLVHAFSFHGNKAVKEVTTCSWFSSDMQLRQVQGTYLLDWVHFKTLHG